MEEKEKENTPAILHNNNAILAVVAAIAVVVLAAAFVLGGGTKEAQAAESTETTAATAATEVTEPAITVPAETVEETTAPAPTTPADTGADDVSCKGTYTADDEAVLAAKDQIVARMGDQQLTVAQLQVYYWMEVRSFLNNYGAYAAYFGLDYTQPLDQQTCLVSDAGLSWQQYFLDTAVDSWKNYAAMARKADAENVQMTEAQRTSLEGMAAELEKDAADNGFADADDLIRQSLGGGVTMQDYLGFVELYYKANAYYNAICDTIQPTDAELEAYFTEHEESYAASGIARDSSYVDVRHILVFPEGADSSNATSQEWPEEAWQAAEQKAQALLESWQAGEKTEDSFAVLANENSQDGGSNTNGGLYENVTAGEMVTAFNDWCFDASRQPGDTGIVKTEYGYHVMYFVSSRLMWKEYAESDYISEMANAKAEEVAAEQPMSVNWNEILLSSVALG